MTEQETLKEARLRMRLTQEEAANLVEVGVATWRRWENGIATPQLYHIRKLEEKLGVKAETFCFQQRHGTRHSFTSSALGKDEKMNASHAFLTNNMTMHLLHIAYSDIPSNDKLSRVCQAIREFDSMNTNDKNYQITRREALCSLATLPMITLGLSVPGSTVQSTQYGTALAHCSASIEACWGLARSGDAYAIQVAFECASKYLDVLKDIVSHSSQYRQRAAELAARYAIIKTVAGWHCEGYLYPTIYAADAVKYGKEAGNASLLLSAYSKLAWAQFYNKKYSSALLTAQEAQSFLEQTKTPLPNGIIGGTYSTLALIQAGNHQDTDLALGKVSEIDPGDKIIDFMEFTRLDQVFEAALTHIYRGDSTKAISTLSLLIDPDTLERKVPRTQTGQIDDYNSMALALLNSKNRNMDKVIALWTNSITITKAVQSEWGYEDVLSLYNLMQAAWPAEKRIKDLRDLIQHW